MFFFFSSRRRHTRYIGDWSSDVCSSDLSWAKRWASGTSKPAPLCAPRTTLSTKPSQPFANTEIQPVRRKPARRLPQSAQDRKSVVRERVEISGVGVALKTDEQEDRSEAS